MARPEGENAKSIIRELREWDCALKNAGFQGFNDNPPDSDMWPNSQKPQIRTKA